MDDLISSQAAMDALHMDTSIIPFKKAREYADATISEIRNRLEKLPSALDATNCSEFPNNSDTISRQAAIDYFVTNVGFHDEDGYPIEDECELREIWTGYFDGIPSAQPKRGEWIHRPEIGWGEMWMCNQCGEKTISTVMGKPRYNFCPMCGAKMEVTT